jgi:hypothetical protein
MIGRENQNRVPGEAQFLQGAHQPAHVLIQAGDQTVVLVIGDN